MNSTADVPLPPYVKKGEENIPRPSTSSVQAPPSGLPVMTNTFKKEAEVFEKSEIEVLPQKNTEDRNVDEKKFSMGEDRILVDSGISMVEERPIVEKEHLLPNTETQKSVLSGIEHPQAGVSSILGQKLSQNMSQIQKASNYSSLDKIPTPPSTSVPIPQTQKDPYHEVIE